MATQQPTAADAWVVDPKDPLTLYALGHRGMRSRDGGHTWSVLGWPPDAQALWFAQKRAPALYLQVADPTAQGQNQVLQSSDGGDTWLALGVQSFLALVDRESGPVLVATTEQGVRTSADNGATWVESSIPLSPNDFPQFGNLVVSNGPAPAVYLGAHLLSQGGLSVVLVSTDAGATFVAKPTPIAPDFVGQPPHLSVDCQGRIYLVTDRTVLRSSDAGSTWQTVGNLESDHDEFDVVPAPSSACTDHVYAFGYQAPDYELWQLDGAGGVVSRTLPGSGTLSDLGQDRLLLVGRDALIQRSDDAGGSWWTAGVSLTDSLAVSPARAGLLFDSTRGGVLRSDDAGKTWQPTLGKVSAVDPGILYADAVDPNMLYARTVFGSEVGEEPPHSFISKDGGASFQAWPVPSADQPEMPVTIVPAASGAVTVVTQNGVYRTDDLADHFTTLLTVPAPQQVLSATIGASEPPAIYASIFNEDGSNQVMSSTDGGVTWSSADPGAYVTYFAISPTNPQVAFTISSRSIDPPGILRTLDGGNSWQLMAAPGNETELTLGFDPRPPYVLRASGKHEYRSDDQGNTWQPVANAPVGVRLPTADDFAFDPSGAGVMYSLRNGSFEKWVE